jgi:hypothetical protein
MLKDTVECGNLYSRCHTRAEIRSMKDLHVAARIQQFATTEDNGIDVKKCSVVSEYLDSGRADVKASDEEKCTPAQVWNWNKRKGRYIDGLRTILSHFTFHLTAFKEIT